MTELAHLEARHGHLVEPGRLVVGDETFVADQLLLGIGMTPAVDLAVAAGLDVNDGVLVDAKGRTSNPHIFAAGDVTRHPSRFTGDAIRLESWANAQNQAIVAAKAALGQPIEYHDLPWAWSDQYDVNLQIVGFPERGARIMTKASSLTGGMSWLALDADGAAVGAVSANAARDLRLVRKVLAAGQDFDLSQWVEIPVAAAL